VHRPAPPLRKGVATSVQCGMVKKWSNCIFVYFSMA
jgi:hypothetical protein